MQHRVKWSNVVMVFDVDTGLIDVASPKIIMGKHRRQIRLNEVRAVGYLPQVEVPASASEFLRKNEPQAAGIRLRDGFEFWVPCAFKSTQQDGIRFVHAVGKATGLTLLVNEHGRPHPRILYGSARPVAPSSPLPPEERTCPFCAETIKAAAIVCRYCSRDLPPMGTPTVEPVTPVEVVDPPMLTDAEFSQLSASYGKHFLEAMSVIDRLALKPRFPAEWIGELSGRIANGAVPEAAAQRIPMNWRGNG